jgi:hypothetical protein
VFVAAIGLRKRAAPHAARGFIAVLALMPMVVCRLSTVLSTVDVRRRPVDRVVVSGGCDDDRLTASFAPATAGRRAGIARAGRDHAPEQRRGSANEAGAMRICPWLRRLDGLTAGVGPSNFRPKNNGEEFS